MDNHFSDVANLSSMQSRLNKERHLRKIKNTLSCGISLVQAVHIWCHIYRPDYNYLGLTHFTQWSRKCPTFFQYNHEQHFPILSKRAKICLYKILLSCLVCLWALIRESWYSRNPPPRPTRYRLFVAISKFLRNTFCSRSLACWLVILVNQTPITRHTDDDDGRHTNTQKIGDKILIPGPTS